MIILNFCIKVLDVDKKILYLFFLILICSNRLEFCLGIDEVI